MNYLIETQEQFDELQPVFADLKEAQGNVAVDTEFLREKTYNAKLCLVQLGIDDNQYCIDVLAIDDLAALIDLFIDETVTKLFHAARQDMEVIWQTLGVLPKPVFDTQLAAAFCGLDLQLGHTALVFEKLGVELAKSQARTDWARRPLSRAQLDYAAEDVTYLAQLHVLLLEELESSNKLDWFTQELQDLYDTDRYNLSPEQAYQRLNGGSLKLSEQYVLRDLATWREWRAQRSDIPRAWVLRDDKLYTLAAKQPQTAEAVLETGIFGWSSTNRLAPLIAEIVAGVEVGEDPLWRASEPFDKQQKGDIATMMHALKALAKKHHIAQGLLGTRKDVEALYRYRESVRLLSGWRKEVVGQPLLNLVQ